MSIDHPVPEGPRLSGPYAASAGQTVFSGTFPLQYSGDVDVIRLRGGQRITLDENTHYQLTGVGGPGFTVTLLAGSLEGDTITLSGNAAIDRTTSIAQAGRFNSTMIDGELDRNRMIDQELDRRQKGFEGRALRAPEGEALDELLPAAERANALLAFDADGQPTGFSKTLLPGSPDFAENAIYVTQWHRTMLNDGVCRMCVIGQSNASGSTDLPVGEAADVFSNALKMVRNDTHGLITPVWGTAPLPTGSAPFQQCFTPYVMRHINQRTGLPVEAQLVAQGSNSFWRWSGGPDDRSTHILALKNGTGPAIAKGMTLTWDGGAHHADVQTAIDLGAVGLIGIRLRQNTYEPPAPNTVLTFSNASTAEVNGVPDANLIVPVSSIVNPPFNINDTVTFQATANVTASMTVRGQVTGYLALRIDNDLYPKAGQTLTAGTTTAIAGAVHTRARVHFATMLSNFGARYAATGKTLHLLVVNQGEAEFAEGTTFEEFLLARRFFYDECDWHGITGIDTKIVEVTGVERMQTADRNRMPSFARFNQAIASLPMVDGRVHVVSAYEHAGSPDINGDVYAEGHFGWDFIRNILPRLFEMAVTGATQNGYAPGLEALRDEMGNFGHAAHFGLRIDTPAQAVTRLQHNQMRGNQIRVDTGALYANGNVTIILPDVIGQRWKTKIRNKVGNFALNETLSWNGGASTGVITAINGLELEIFSIYLAIDGQVITGGTSGATAQFDGRYYASVSSLMRVQAWRASIDISDAVQSGHSVTIDAGDAQISLPQSGDIFVDQMVLRGNGRVDLEWTPRGRWHAELAMELKGTRAFTAADLAFNSPPGDAVFTVASSDIRWVVDPVTSMVDLRFDLQFTLVSNTTGAGILNINILPFTAVESMGNVNIERFDFFDLPTGRTWLGGEVFNNSKTLRLRFAGDEFSSANVSPTTFILGTQVRVAGMARFKCGLQEVLA